MEQVLIHPQGQRKHNMLCSLLFCWFQAFWVLNARNWGWLHCVLESSRMVVVLWLNFTYRAWSELKDYECAS